MYNVKDIQFVGKHDYDGVSARKFLNHHDKTFSVNIFRWELKTNGKEMKRGKCVVRVIGTPNNIDNVLDACEKIVEQLDNKVWGKTKTVTIK